MTLIINDNNVCTICGAYYETTGYCSNGHIKKVNKMDTTYESGDVFKFSEEDIYDEGCIPKGNNSNVIDIHFEDKTLKGLIDKIKDYWDITDEYITLDSCDEVGRLDFTLMETGAAFTATESDIDLWKQGKKRLWCCDYTYYIQKVMRESVTLTI